MIPAVPPPDWQPSPDWIKPARDGDAWVYTRLAWRIWVRSSGVPGSSPRVILDGCGLGAEEWFSGAIWQPGVAEREDLLRLALYRAELLAELLDAGTIARVRP